MSEHSAASAASTEAAEGAAVEGATVEGAAVEGAAVEGAAVEGAAVEGATVEGATVGEERVLSAFTASLDRLGVGWTRCSADGFAAALARVADAPAVGTALPFEEVTLDGSGVVVGAPLEAVKAARTGVTAAVMGIAAYGSVVIQHGATAESGAEAVSLFPERHVAVLRASDVVPDLPSALARLAEAIRAGRTSFVIATGPSATADMGALVKGAHGPREVHVILLDDPDEAR